jgi:hypothetical protein
MSSFFLHSRSGKLHNNFTISMMEEPAPLHNLRKEIVVATTINLSRRKLYKSNSRMGFHSNELKGREQINAQHATHKNKRNSELPLSISLKISPKETNHMMGF